MWMLLLLKGGLQLSNVVSQEAKGLPYPDARPVLAQGTHRKVLYDL